MAIEDSEQEKQRKLAAALAQQQPAAPAPARVQPGSSPKAEATDPGGFGKAGSFKEGSGQVTEGVTRTAAGALTFGTSEIPIGGKSLGERAGEAARKVDNKTQDLLRKLDPTNTSIPAANTARLDAAGAGVQTAAGKAAALAQALAANPVTAQQVQAPQGMEAAQVAAPSAIQADRVRGTTERVQAGQAQAGNFEAAQVAGLERVQAAQLSRDDAALRERQFALADALQQQAAGQGPSVAEASLRRSGEQAIASQQALAASARGGNPVLAQRQAAQNVAAIQQDQAGRAAELRIAEQAQARAQLGSVLDSTRGQDIGVATTQAQLQQQAATTNKQAEDARALAQAQLVQDAAKTSALEAGTTSRFNVDATLRADTSNQDADTRAALADQGASLTAQTATATNDLTAGTFNAKAQDEMARFQADAGLRAGIANQAASLQAQGMTIDGIAKALGLEAASLQAVLTSEGELLKGEQARLSEQKKAETNMGGSILGSAAQVIAMCFPAGQQVELESGKGKSVELVQLGERLSTGVVLGLRQYASNEALYRVGEATMTGSHPVWLGDAWHPASDVGELVGEAAPRTVYSLVTTSGLVVVGGMLCGDDTRDAAELNQKECA